MKKRGIWLVVGVLLLAACASAPSGEQKEDVLYLNLVWHQHQPLYYQDPDTGVYSRPWVRVHATKSYYDMAAILRDYPDVRATFNLTPVLLRQLEDFANGAKDRYWVLAEKAPSDLTNEEKQFILERFFDANHTNMIGKFPRYTELLEKKEEIDTRTLEGITSFSDQDYLDLQVLFNLAWFDPIFLDQEPLAALVDKGRDFVETDKAVLFEQALKVIRDVVPVHRELQDAGQIEVITTPYAHPILPLIFSTTLASENDPTAELPEEFYYPNDAVAHLELSRQIYEEKFGRSPVGLWPAEGSVAQEIVKMVGDAGYQWMASGEQVLAKSLGIESFVRDASDTVTAADALYRPYIVQPRRGEPVTIVFRDLRLSDLIGFEYSGTDGEAAAADFMRRLENIRTTLRESAAEDGPHLVSVILDGENAWEHYPNDGKEFLNALYRMLSESATIETTTVPEFMERFPQQRTIDDLWPGSWFSSDYSTWIGEPEETKAWNLLGRVREFLALYDMRGRRTTTPERLALAKDYMYLAEGSDWFWWYGSDQDSGQDEYFDEAYRELLSNVFRALDEPVPAYLRVPIIPERAAPPSKRPNATFTPTVDGRRGADEWTSGGYYQNTGTAQARASDVLDRLDYGFSTERMHLFLESAVPFAELSTRGSVHVYIGYPGQISTASFVDGVGESLIGFDASTYLRIDSDGTTLYRLSQDDLWEQMSVDLTSRVSGRSAEVSFALDVFGDVESGDEISFRAFFVEQAGATDLLPASGPGQTNVPDLGGGELVLSVNDPEGDDHGPGTYEYPSDTVFGPGVYDITSFVVEDEEEYLKFTVGLAGSIQNPWSSPINLSVQTIDIYLDIDPGMGTGARSLLEGRNAALPAESGWEFALWVEGWNQKVLTPLDPRDPASPPTEMSGSPLRVRIDSDAGRVIIRMPKELLPEGVDPYEIGYAVAVMSQEGFPSAGVRRVRDVARAAGQWVIGGAPADSAHHTRIIDMVVPVEAPVSQEELLSDYTVSAGAGGAALAPDDLPRAFLINP